MGQSQGTSGEPGYPQDLQARYHVEDLKLGEGAYGSVWRATDLQTREFAAIKKMSKHKLRNKMKANPDYSFEKEVTLMRACRHDNIAQVLETFIDGNSVYLVLEYCAGGNLSNKVRAVQGLGHTLSESKFASWALQMCRAVVALHSMRICHRDIKPDNMLLQDSSGLDGMLKLSDFGLAVFLPEGQLLRERCGTPVYMSPELFLLSEDPSANRNRKCGYGFPADVWALGVSIWQVMLFGRHPFSDDAGRFERDMLLRGYVERTQPLSNLAAMFGLEQAPDDRMSSCSHDARQLCRQLVLPCPVQRASANDALINPWLTQIAFPSSRDVSPKNGALRPQSPRIEASRLQTPMKEVSRPQIPTAQSGQSSGWLFACCDGASPHHSPTIAMSINYVESPSGRKFELPLTPTRAPAAMNNISPASATRLNLVAATLSR
ncbi:unnamed protein product [Polarella glacialis]|uniref:Protein kinase domain-containing protein n=1 Tax=Polarella glacialis TaxID=89957 RepID=A0A813I2R8_POLGL|nr:unnamed protein product [Polarella glacialis]